MNCVITNGACYIKRNNENLLVATDSLGDALLQLKKHKLLWLVYQGHCKIKDLE